ncbi:GNAT family N-acetyltransferase [Janibacter sp. G56]|uniref:GNAT family N-acetyltransferase n=1 Tax=Janibacter sp. G56 TaxID=3418717 RepID=UPI003D019456
MARLPHRRDRRPDRSSGRAQANGGAPATNEPQGPVIRRAVAHDIATLVNLRALMYEAMGTSSDLLAQREWQENAARWWQLRLAESDVNVTVAEVNGAVVASVMGQVIRRTPSPRNPTGTAGLISNVATFPGHRRIGLSEQCVEQVMAWFREETAAEVVELFATEAGRPIYERLGFTEHAYPQLRVSIDRGDTQQRA